MTRHDDRIRYDRVDFDIVWEIVKTDLPPMVEAIDRFLLSDPERE